MKIRSLSVFLGMVLVATFAVIPSAADAQPSSYSSAQLFSCGSYYSYSACDTYDTHSSNNSSYRSSQPSYVQATYILSTDSYYYPGYGEYPYHAEDPEQIYDEWTGTWY